MQLFARSFAVLMVASVRLRTLIGLVAAASFIGRAASAQIGPIHVRPTVELRQGTSDINWEIRAEHPFEILIAAGDSLDVVLLAWRCRESLRYEERGCFGVRTTVAGVRWTLDDTTRGRARTLPTGRWFAGPGAAGGRVYALRPGTTKINAFQGDVWLANSPVRIISAPGAVRVRLEPKPKVIVAGDTVRFRVTALDSRDRIVAIVPLSAGYNIVGPPDSLGFTPVAFMPWETGGRMVVMLGRLADTLELNFRKRGEP